MFKQAYVLFFSAVKANLVKHTVLKPDEKESSEEIDLAIQQLVTKATMPVGVIDLLASYGVKSPDISILSDDFLAEMRNMKHKNMQLNC